MNICQLLTSLYRINIYKNEFKISIAIELEVTAVSCCAGSLGSPPFTVASTYQSSLIVGHVVVIASASYILYPSHYTFRPSIAVRRIGMSLKVIFMKLQLNNVLQTVNMFYIL